MKIAYMIVSLTNNIIIYYSHSNVHKKTTRFYHEPYDLKNLRDCSHGTEQNIHYVSANIYLI